MNITSDIHHAAIVAARFSAANMAAKNALVVLYTLHSTLYSGMVYGDALVDILVDIRSVIERVRDLENQTGFEKMNEYIKQMESK